MTPPPPRKILLFPGLPPVVPSPGCPPSHTHTHTLSVLLLQSDWPRISSPGLASSFPSITCYLFIYFCVSGPRRPPGPRQDWGRCCRRRTCVPGPLWSWDPGFAPQALGRASPGSWGAGSRCKHKMAGLGGPLHRQLRHPVSIS